MGHKTAANLPATDHYEPTPAELDPAEIALRLHDCSTLVGRPEAELPMRDLGKYQLREVLGSGGQSIAFKAWDRDLLRHVVIKVYHNAGSDAERQRILSEGRALARVRHAQVCTCFAVDRLGEMPYLVLQYIPGETLKDRIACDAIPDGDVIRIVLDLCGAVDAIHQCGLLHCDLKPGNIMIDTSNSVTVIDLGLATTQLNLTPDDVAGTPAYLAPERANGEVEQIDERCDVFGLGAILYELLTGRAPFADSTRGGSRARSKLGIVSHAGRFHGQLPAGLADVVMRSVARFPSQRYRNVGALRDALMAVRCD